MRLSRSLVLAASLLALWSPSAFSMDPMEVRSSVINKPLMELRPNLLDTGTLEVDINGTKAIFKTTSEKITISAERLQAASPQQRAMMEKMNGKRVHTATLHSAADRLIINLRGYGTQGDKAPQTSGPNASSLQLNFALNPETLELLPQSRDITYCAAGVSILNGARTKDFTLNLESATRLQNDGISLKGSFSATLTTDRRKRPLSKPLTIQGTFDIQRADRPTQ